MARIPAQYTGRFTQEQLASIEYAVNWAITGHKGASNDKDMEIIAILVACLEDATTATRHLLFTLDQAIARFDGE